MKEGKKLFFVLGFILLLSLSFVSAGLFSDFFKGTGDVVEEEYGISENEQEEIFEEFEGFEEALVEESSCKDTDDGTFKCVLWEGKSILYNEHEILLDDIDGGEVEIIVDGIKSGIMYQCDLNNFLGLKLQIKVHRIEKIQDFALVQFIPIIDEDSEYVNFVNEQEEIFEEFEGFEEALVEESSCKDTDDGTFKCVLWEGKSILYNEHEILLDDIDGGEVEIIVDGIKSGIMYQCDRSEFLGLKLQVKVYKIEKMNDFVLVQFMPILEDNDCIDFDGGINYYEKGDCYDYATFSSVPRKDWCEGDVLNEAHCSESNSCAYQGYLCPNGCKDGACVEEFMNIEISISTEKDVYSFGEQINLTSGSVKSGITGLSLTGNVISDLDNEDFRGEEIDYEKDYQRFESLGDSGFSDEVFFQQTISSGEVIYDEMFEQEKEYDGYIIQFEEEPVLVEKINLEKKAERNFVYSEDRAQIVQNVRDFFLLMPNEVDEKVQEYSVDLKEKNELVKSKIVDEVYGVRQKSITGNAVKREDVKSNMGREFTTAFNGVSMKISDEEAKELEKIRGVKKVYRNYKVEATLMDSVSLINADDVWQIKDSFGNNLTGEGVTIAIIDTGIDHTHADLGGCFGEGCKVVGGYDFVNEDEDPMDDQGHGTHCAATAAGNGVLKGVAPDAKLYGFKVLNEGGGGYSDWIIAGIERSIDLDNDGIPMEDKNDYVNVISLSLGGYGNPDDSSSQAIDTVVEAGIVAVIAAGNSGCENCIGSPGTARKAITVGASDKFDNIASFSSRGPVIWEDGEGIEKALVKPDVTAPGVDICAAQWDEAWTDRECLDTEHTAISGTSMATPHVAGAAALLIQKNPSWTPLEIKMALRNTAVDIGENIITQGQGRIDILETVSLDERPLVAELEAMDYLPFGEVDIYGTAKGGGFESYSVYYSLKEMDDWSLICSGESVVEEDVLCLDFNTGILLDGDYEVKLVDESVGGKISEDYGIFEVDNVKIFSPLNNDIYRAGDIIEIKGNVIGSNFESYSVEYKEGDSGEWLSDEIELVNNGNQEVVEDVLGYWDTSSITEAGFYSIRLVVNYLDGSSYEEFVEDVYLDPTIKEGWPVRVSDSNPLGSLNVVGISGGNLGSFVLYLTSHLDMVDQISFFYLEDNNLERWGEGVHNPSLASIGDLDGDGINEFCFAEEPKPSLYENLLFCFEQDGSYMVGWPVSVYDLIELLIDDFGTGENIEIGYNTYPIISDIDDDGELEIVVGFWFHGETGIDWGIVIYNGEGSIENFWVIPHFCDSNWDLCETSCRELMLGVGDINSDGKKEIVVGSSGAFFGSLSSGQIWGSAQSGQDVMVFDYNGVEIEGWNENSGISTGSPVLADLNGDGFLEIIYSGIDIHSIQLEVISEDPPNAFFLVNESLVVRNYEGQIIWSKNFVPSVHGNINNFAVGDTNMDGFLEVYVTSFGKNNSASGNSKLFSYLYGFNHTGGLLEGFPIEIDGDLSSNFDFAQPKSLVIGDIDGDSFPDFLLQGTLIESEYDDFSNKCSFYLIGFNRFGEEIFSKIVRGFSSFAERSLFLTDFDYDGMLDIFVGFGYNKNFDDGIISFNLGVPYNSSTMDWPMFQHDPQHTGCYNCDDISVIPLRPQSKIINNNDFDVSGNLRMVLQKKIGESWIDEKIVANEQVSILANDYFDLANKGNFQNIITNSIGTYRAYVSFEVEGETFEDNWEFEVI